MFFPPSKLTTLGLPAGPPMLGFLIWERDLGVQ